ncbi:MAG: DUF4249 domain-containing protein [Chitinophagaceae bacterium]
MQRLKYLLLSSLIVFQFSCRETFAPPEVASPEPVLVVEGVLVAGSEPTRIRLSRSSRLDTINAFAPESNAVVIVEGKDNSIQILAELGSGIYSSPALNMTVGQEYRLHITTNNSREYLSEFITVKQTPPIDNIGFKQTEEGVRLHVNTHDQTNSTRYYLWNYDETWEIRSYFFATVIYRGGDTVEPRIFPQENVSRCWKYGISTNILINSSEKLSDDVIFEGPLAFFPNGDERLGVRYSMLLRQYAIDKAAYEFYELMKRNTESLGTVFDPQPTEISGNIRCITDPAELVIGYVTASTPSVTRYFLNNSELRGFRYPQYCMTENIRNHPDSIRGAYSSGGLMPYDALYSAMGPSVDTTHWFSAPAECVDCTKRGGNLAMPTYW